MFHRCFCLAAAFSALTFFGTTARADDLSDIRASGKAFAQALHDGDVTTAKHYAVTDATTEKALDIMGEITKARKTLIDAAVAKWGDEGKNVAVGGPNGAQTESVRTNFQDAKIEVKGDTAMVTSKDGQDSRPAYFKKEGGIWKIDLPKLANFASVTRLAPQSHMIADAFTATAAEIRDGKYKTVQDAKLGVRQNLAAAAQRMRRG
jgi:hypothetical protein